jgi:hypothetical protein
MLAIAHHVSSPEAFRRQLDYTSISDDPEDYSRCIARERAIELETCRNTGIPAFLVMDNPERRSIHISGHGAQNNFGDHLLTTTDFAPVDDLAGHSVLLRASVSHEQSLLKFLKGKGARLIADWKSQELTMEWYRHVFPRYLKRNMAWFPIDGIFEQDLSRFKDADGRFFCKTNFKIQGCSAVTDDLVPFFGYEIEMMGPSTEVLISEAIPLATDQKGKLEYRCFVVANKVSSISRHLDYDTGYAIPECISDFAGSFVDAHRSRLPACYVLDVAETTDRGPVVIELNGIVASGRYERNDFGKLLADLRQP